MFVHSAGARRDQKVGHRQMTYIYYYIYVYTYRNRNPLQRNDYMCLSDCAETNVVEDASDND